MCFPELRIVYRPIDWMLQSRFGEIIVATNEDNMIMSRKYGLDHLNIKFYFAEDLALRLY